MLINELAQKILIAVVCLGLGYVVGRYRGQATMGLPRRQRWRDIGGTIMGVIVVVAVGFTTFQVQTESTHQRDQARCLADYSYRVAQSVTERRAANAERDRQLIGLVDTILTGDRGTNRAALAGFRDAVAEAERRGAAVPLPEPPRCD